MLVPLVVPRLQQVELRPQQVDLQPVLPLALLQPEALLLPLGRLLPELALRLLLLVVRLLRRVVLLQVGRLLRVVLRLNGARVRKGGKGVLWGVIPSGGASSPSSPSCE